MWSDFQKKKKVFKEEIFNFDFASLEGIRFIPACLKCPDGRVGVGGNILHYEMFPGKTVKKRAEIALHLPSEMATHELQRVVVGRRHVEHQTLQTIHFVHVVRHLCSTERENVSDKQTRYHRLAFLFHVFY